MWLVHKDLCREIQINAAKQIFKKICLSLKTGFAWKIFKSFPTPTKEQIKHLSCVNVLFNILQPILFSFQTSISLFSLVRFMHMHWRIILFLIRYLIYAKIHKSLFQHKYIPRDNIFLCQLMAINKSCMRSTYKQLELQTLKSLKDFLSQTTRLNVFAVFLFLEKIVLFDRVQV